MNNNQIETIQGLENLKKLISLDLSSNQIKILNLNIFTNFLTIDLKLNNLTVLYINKNKYLILINNNYEMILELTFSNLKEIELINLDNNHISNVEQTAFYSLKSLKYLSIKNISIKMPFVRHKYRCQ